MRLRTPALGLLAVPLLLSLAACGGAGDGASETSAPPSATQPATTTPEAPNETTTASAPAEPTAIPLTGRVAGEGEAVILAYDGTNEILVAGFDPSYWTITQEDTYTAPLGTSFLVEVRDDLPHTDLATLTAAYEAEKPDDVTIVGREDSTDPWGNPMATYSLLVTVGDIEAKQTDVVKVAGGHALVGSTQRTLTGPGEYAGAIEVVQSIH